jgi:hypothetical protein
VLFDRTLDVIEDAMEARQFLVMNRALVDGERGRRMCDAGVYYITIAVVANHFGV